MFVEKAECCPWASMLVVLPLTGVSKVQSGKKDQSSVRKQVDPIWSEEIRKGVRIQSRSFGEQVEFNYTVF